MATEKPGSLAMSLDRVYRERGGWLREIAARGGRDEASDVVHDAVVKTLEAGRKAEILEPVRFLFQVTRNTLLDRFRARKRQGRVFEYGLEDADAPDMGASAEVTLLASERLQQALEVIERMPPRRREAFLLCRVEELTYAQAGRRMGVTVHAIEKHMSAAMAQLHAELNVDRDVA